MTRMSHAKRRGGKPRALKPGQATVHIPTTYHISEREFKLTMFVKTRNLVEFNGILNVFLKALETGNHNFTWQINDRTVD